MLSNRKLIRDKYYLLSWVLIFVFLVYSIILAIGSHEGSPETRTDGPFFPYLSDKPLTEDGYYLLTVAWRIAEGKGFSYNRDIKTTGVQPLAAIFFSVPAFIVQNSGGNKYDFARVIIILSGLMQVLFAFLIYKIALALSSHPDKSLYFLFSVCVVLLNFKVILNFTNGLETGMYLVLLSIFLLCWLKYMEMQLSIPRLVILGLFSGLLLLCRLDAIVILLTFYLLLLFNRRIKVIQLAIILLITFLLYLPWQLYIWEVTGNILQSSAQSQTGLFSYFDKAYQIEQYFSSIIQQVTPFLYTGNVNLWLMFPLGGVYLLLLIVLIRKFKIQILASSSLNLINPLLIAITVLVIVYFIFSSAPYFYFRYLVFIQILSLPVAVIVFSSLFVKLKKYLSLFMILILIFSFAMQAYFYFHSGKSALGITMRPTFIKENFDENKLIGAFQSGALGYYVDNVVNLDGKISIAALQSLNKGSIEQYIDDEGIDVLVEWDDAFVWILDSLYLQNNWDIYTMDIGDGLTRCYVRKGFSH